MKTDNPELAKIIRDCFIEAQETTNVCMYPDCNKKSIKSHIMQKNGILSSISEDSHLWEFDINHFEKEFFMFKKNGINKIYTFLGFCNEHDTSVFKKIESGENIDFDDYESCALFALRTICNEKWIKIVVRKHHLCLLNHPNYKSNEKLHKEVIHQNTIAIEDMEFLEQSLWKDLSEKSESFVFEWREFLREEICLNSIFTYETSREIMEYAHEFGEDKERLTEIFISFFPYQDKSILIMGYLKEDFVKAKPFVNSFMKEKIKWVHRRLSNLIILNCETWVCSPKFYEEKFKGLDSDFHRATIFSSTNGHERKVFPINLFAKDFRTNFNEFIKQNKI